MNDEPTCLEQARMGIEISPQMEAALAEIERLRAENENLPCGHRKRDMDDSYGGCMFCQAMASINENDDEVERLQAEVERKVC